MTLHIHKERLISELQREFNESYPYLKIELFAGRHGYQEGSSSGGRLPRQMPLKYFAQHIPEGSIEVNDAMSVHELEQVFRDRFGLNLQVFRKSGNLWLETTVTDSWSLKQQNDHGREISTYSKSHPGI